MSTMVYLANQQIQVVIGSPGKTKIRINKCFEAEAPEGSIINGIVMDTESFVEFLKEFWKSNKIPAKDVTLVVNSSKFVGKTLELPMVSMKKAYGMMEKEFADINRDQNCLYSFLPLGPGAGKLQRVYAESVETDFVGEYLQIFQEAGIQVKSILSGESSLIKLTGITIGRAHSHFAVIIADSNILTTILWINGSFYYFNSTRSFYEPETEEYAADVARSVSRLTQFMQANQIEQRLECIILAGIHKNMLPLYQNALEQMGIMTRVDLFEASTLAAAEGIEIQKYLRPASGLSVLDKHLNFLSMYSSKSKRKSEKKEKLGINIKPIVISFVAVVVIFVGAMVISNLKKSELEVLTEYNESPAVISEVMMYDVMLEQNDYLNSQYTAILDIDENIQTYPIGDSKIKQKIEKCAEGYADVSFYSFDAAAGTIEMDASSETVDDINLFIRRLLEQDFFNQVNYTGYAFNDTDQCWDIHVTCTLAESAGR